MKTTKPTKSNPNGLTEAHVEETVTQFLELDGWRSFKMEANSERGFVERVMRSIRSNASLAYLATPFHSVMRSCMRAQGVGEPGMPDRLFVRYYDPRVDRTEWLEGEGTAWQRAQAQLLWIEMKRPGEKPRADQIAWHEAERARGGLVLIVSDIDDFMKRWYPQSGLQRRRPPMVR